MINVYCVKWGTKYDRGFVERLKTSIEKHFTIKHKFNCFTDKPEKDYDIPITHPELRGVWHKLALFQFTGENLFFDLDVKINDNIDFLAERFDKFMKHRDLYLRLYKGIDRFIWNEQIGHTTFKGNAISSWQEGIEDNTIVLYNGRYENV